MTLVPEMALVASPPSPVRTPAGRLLGRPAGRSTGRPGGAYRRGGKRALDVALVLLAAAPVLLALALLAALVALDGHRPFYVQERLGRYGATFRMWKLRTMRPDADAVLARLLASDAGARAEWEHAQKLREDPRVTPVGRLLRKSSLDELPQLWNVLRGDMSLVGPRPMMPDQRPLYPGTEYFALRPGLTGPWQVSARNDSGFAERAAFDRGYLRSLSFATDLVIVLRTVRVVLRGTGC